MPRHHLPRRALLLFVATIVLPVCVLLWLGLQSFERQRQAVRDLTEEKLDAAVDRETRRSAELAFDNRAHPIAQHFFVIERGVVVEPALRTLLPRPVPVEFAAAERQEIGLKRPDLALEQYRRLLADGRSPSLAMQFMARSLSALGRESEARDTWRRLARQFPDDRDLAHRPYGIVAAINAGETAGLFDLISSGRWTLPADQAEHFLTTLDPERAAPFLARYEFARALEDGFIVPASVRAGEIYTASLGDARLFYRDDGPGRVVGFSAKAGWLAETEARLRSELRVDDARREAGLLYGGAIAVVLAVLTTGIVALVRDVSRESRLNCLQADFVNGVTHELKTPLSILRLYGDTLLRQRDLSEAERRDLYRVISRESTRLGRLIDQILAFSRVERGESEYDLQPGDLAPVVTGVVDDYSGWLEHAGFTVDRHLPESMPMVRFDSTGVTQAVVNLLDNAAKYSGASRHIGVRLEAAEGQVTFAVEDHGIGLSAEDCERVFDRFYRATNGTGKGGYGIGLFMVQHIMEAHGGRAKVVSQPGHGSTFRLIFPVVSA